MLSIHLEAQEVSKNFYKVSNIKFIASNHTNKCGQIYAYKNVLPVKKGSQGKFPQLGPQHFEFHLLVSDESNFIVINKTMSS